jgi:hypothetical protein
VGLAWAGSLRSYVPWSGSESLPGVDVAVSSGPLAVGRPSTLRLELSAPSGARLQVEQGLAPGVTVDEPAITASGGSVEVVGDRVRVTTGPFGAGEVKIVEIPVQPSFPGRFTTTPLVITADGREASVRPMTWTIGAER